MTRRVRYLFSGVVQGVGFRPFIYRTALKNDVTGFVQNRREGVVVEAEGPSSAIDAFIEEVRAGLPPMADVTAVEGADIGPRGDCAFVIAASGDGGPAEVHIPPDAATCKECLQELFDPGDRRYRYPFINCTHCGPRLTIIRAIPYDRPNTSMASFPLCPACRREYEDPDDRRFHAEPVACPDCGPAMRLLDARGADAGAADPIGTAVDLLRQGSILAVKGLGGFHLCVDATDDAAVRRLRARKCREEKPLAVMVRDIGQAARLAHISAQERALLISPARPIVLAQKKAQTPLSPAIAPGVPDLGLLLPYTPLHHLLLEKHFLALVMTSANRVDEPICIGNGEARTRLAGIADFFLVHDRDIVVRCDDSVIRVAAGKETPIRRSRGYAPKPLALRTPCPEVLALGPEMKSTICIVRGRHAFLSPHIGDLETPQARDFYHESLALLQDIAGCRPEAIACDMHPAYYSTRVALATEGREVIRVQHHHAHIASCMAEHGLAGEVIGLAMDGTGYGPDGRIWGGEFLVAGESRFSRAGHLRVFPLPGGDRAAREPWRVAASLLRQAFGSSWPEQAARLGLAPDQNQFGMLEAMMAGRINCPETSSLGRVFDGVAALAGLRRVAGFEGQAATELEALGRGTTAVYPFEIADRENGLELDLAPAIRQIVESRLAGDAPENAAAAFHGTLAAAFAAMAERIRRKTGLNRVVLSGGCFQNRLLTEGAVAELRRGRFEVFTHCRVPANDGGISLGQAVVAAATIRAREAGMDHHG